MADDSTKPHNPTDAIQEEAINTLTHQLNELEELIEQVSDAASKSLNQNERGVIHGLLADLKHQHQVERARLKDMIDARDSKESLDAGCTNVVDVEGLRLDKEEEEEEGEEHDEPIAGSVQRDSYMRQWFWQKLEPEAEAKTHDGIQEGEAFDNDDDAKNVLIKKTMRYERDLYYMFRNLLTTIWNRLDPEGNVTVTVYEEFKDCLKWLASGVDNQVLRCIRLILNVFNKGIERVIGVGKSRKGKEIVQHTKSRRIDKIFDLILEQIQYTGLLWLGTNGTSMDDDYLAALLRTTESWEMAHEELKFNVQEWLDTLRCRHCSDSCHF